MFKEKSGLPPQKPVDGAFVAQPIPGGNEDDTLCKEQNLERDIERLRKARRVAENAAYDAVTLRDEDDPRRTVYGIPAPTLEQEQ